MAPDLFWEGIVQVVVKLLHPPHAEEHLKSVFSVEKWNKGKHYRNHDGDPEDLGGHVLLPPQHSVCMAYNKVSKISVNVK